MQKINHITSEVRADDSANSTMGNPYPLRVQSLDVATAAEAVTNYRENAAATWYKDGVDENDPAGKYAFQRLRQTWFAPRIVPKFKFRRDDAFYAIGSCFARGLECSLQQNGITVASAAPEFSKLRPAREGVSGLGFTNKYNTYSILNELRWTFDPQAVFPQESIVRLTATTFYDPHTNPTLSFADWEETLQRRALIQAVTKRVKNCRAIVVTLGLAEVWRDIRADVYLNCTPVPSLFKSQPDRYEFHLTTFAQNWANLEAIYELLAQHGHPDFHIIVTVSPVPLMNTFSNMDIVVANTWAKSLLRAVAHEWAAAHSNVDYFPSYEIVQNSSPAAAWERDLR
ncbi:MAG TPA: GSCFA domain-containing protein, partial [Candidatus Udaeobacter sp.]|nr:GSCFA domain-containing protein [Candidatus Udaeobacter sp.]